MTSDADSARRLTALRTLGVSATKTYHRGEEGEIAVEGYGRAKRFTAREISIDREGKWLEKLRGRDDTFVVLGEPVDWPAGVRKRRLSQARDGEKATLIDVPRAIMPIDVDNIDFEPFAAVDDGETFALEVLDRLGLRNVAAVWHLTGSHGFRGKWRIRLWVELSKPMTCAQMRTYAIDRWGDDESKIVDMSVYQPQQPIYTSDPIFLDGIDDPVSAARSGCVEGEPLRVKVTAQAKRARTQIDSDDDDENVRLLKEAGVYIRQLKPGQHMMECPWEDEHSGESRDDDSFYFAPHFNGYDAPSYKCHHDSCRDKYWDDVVAELSPARARDDTDARDADADDDDDDPAWVFIHRLKSFWDPRDGAIVDRESYDTTHAGTKKRGRPSDRFIASAKCKKVDVAQFAPGKPRFETRSGIRLINTYIDRRIQPTGSLNYKPWVDLLDWMVPDERERALLMDWLAWVYQHPDEKILWAPVLYSRAFGIGKTSVFNALAACIGKEYVSEPTQAELEDRFNDFAYGKLLVKIEELRSGDKFHAAEKLKPVVANPTLSIRRMYQTGFSIVNTANVCASTNHLDALPVETGDRRWMFIQCIEAQEEERRPKMKAFHRWLKRAGHDGIATWLASRDVSAFDPKAEAPRTVLRDVAASASVTVLDRAVGLCEAFDGVVLISDAMIDELLAINNCDLSSRRYPIVAYSRGWRALNDHSSRVRIGNRRLRFWCSSGAGELALEAFNAMPLDERERRHADMVSKLVFGAGTRS